MKKLFVCIIFISLCNINSVFATALCKNDKECARQCAKRCDNLDELWITYGICTDGLCVCGLLHGSYPDGYVPGGKEEQKAFAVIPELYSNKNIANTTDIFGNNGIHVQINVTVILEDARVIKPNRRKRDAQSDLRPRYLPVTCKTVQACHSDCYERCKPDLFKGFISPICERDACFCILGQPIPT